MKLAKSHSSEELRGSRGHFRCKEDIRNGVRSLLLYVKNMRSLAGTRDALWELLAAEAAPSSWEVVCQRLLDQPLLFWEDLMQPLFLERVQVSAPTSGGLGLSWGKISLLPWLAGHRGRQQKVPSVFDAIVGPRL